jgi:hypothetical protein
MDLNKKDAGRIKKYRFFLSMAVWWIVILMAYLVVSFKVERIKNDITQTGVELLQEVSVKISLPLLEHDVTSLGQVLQDVAKIPGVLFSSIIDHNHQMIASTDNNPLTPVHRESVPGSDHVSYWEGVPDSHSSVINFSTDVSYAGTKIGEIFLTFSGHRIHRIKKGFFLITISSFIILAFVLSVLHFRGLNAINEELQTRYLPKISFPLEIPEGSNIVCPLCKGEQPFSRELFTRFNSDTLLIVQPDQDAHNSNQLRSFKGIRLSELSNKKDLLWLKRQMIFRCTEIIKNLTV